MLLVVKTATTVWSTQDPGTIAMQASHFLVSKPSTWPSTRSIHILTSRLILLKIHLPLRVVVFSCTAVRALVDLQRSSLPGWCWREDIRCRKQSSRSFDTGIFYQIKVSCCNSVNCMIRFSRGLSNNRRPHRRHRVFEVPSRRCLNDLICHLFSLPF